MEAAIDKCCDPKSLDDNWAAIIQITDTYAVGQPKKCLRCISAKIFQANPNVSMRALTLLDACVKNVGNPFAREMSSRDFVNQFKQKYPKLQLKPRMKLLELVKQWSEEYKSNPELNLLASLYPWVRTEHPEHIRELDHHLSIQKRMKHREDENKRRAKEEEDLAKAIALSLNDAPATDKKTPVPSNYAAAAASTNSTSQSVYPNIGGGPSATNGSKSGSDLGTVKALFDFEAAEDNELTFKTGDLIDLLDTSDANWWRGKSRASGNQGLFPAQFVSRDIGEDSAKDKPNGASPNPASSSTANTTTQKAKIDPQLVENCLEMLEDADTTGVARPDPVDLPAMEAAVRSMEPLIEAELENCYTRITEVDGLKQRLAEALNQYHQMVSISVAAYTNQTSMYAKQPGPAAGGAAYTQPGVYPQPGMYAPPPPIGGVMQPPPQQQQTPATGLYAPPSMMPYGGPFPTGNLAYSVDPNAWQQQQQQQPAPPPQPQMANQQPVPTQQQNSAYPYPIDTSSTNTE